tara:strand:+ start:2673 stop:3404 length:732 start_codon:yes stop_codon:yes gene_type:complete
MRVHFLHVGKTGGSTIKHAIKATAIKLNPQLSKKDVRDDKIIDLSKLTNNKLEIIFHGHGTSLADIPKDEYFVFSIREPISRFVSGFNSRKRQGRPRYNCPWTQSEKKAFQTFNTPDELAISLTSEDKETREMAKRAMQSIRHIKNRLSQWIIDENYLQARSNRLITIIRQDHLQDDFEDFQKRLNINKYIELVNDENVAHRSSDMDDKFLSEKSRSNLSSFLEREFQLYSFCLDLRKKLSAL